MRCSNVLAVMALLALGSTSARAEEPPLKVVTTLGYLGDVARSVGGDLVTVQVLARPGADPHAIDPTPAHLNAVRDADLFVENGVQLEGWAARVLEGAENRRIQRGAAGHLFATTGIEPLELPTAEELAAGGHVHAAGNPHVWLDPLNLEVVAANVARALSAVRPGAAERFEANRLAFVTRLFEAFFGPELVRVIGASQLTRLQRTGRLRAFLAEKKYRDAPLTDLAGGWLRAAIDLGDLPVVTYHRTWSYLAASFGLRVVGTVEEKPGIPPSPGHLERLRRVATGTGARVVLVAPYEPTSRAEGVAEQLGGAAVVLATQPGEVEGTPDVFAMFDQIARGLTDARRRAGP